MSTFEALNRDLRSFTDWQTKQNEQERQTKRQRALLAAEAAKSGATPEEAMKYALSVESGDIESMSPFLKTMGTQAKKKSAMEEAIASAKLLREKKGMQEDTDASYKRGLETQKLEEELGIRKRRPTLGKLGSEEKKSVGGLASGFDAINEMESSINRGVGPEYIDANTPILGNLISDTNYTKSQRIITDVVGRLQSGGAINKDEEARFLAMSPRPGDSAAIAKQKLEDQRIFLRNKLAPYGIDETHLKDLGFKIRDVVNAPQGGQSIPGIEQAAANDPMGLLRNMTRQQKINLLMGK